MQIWSVQVKGNLSVEGHNGHYEISVVRKDNEQGQHSWGWGGPNKIILFGTGLGQNSLPLTKANIDFALWIADTLCTMLNEKRDR